MCSLLGIKRCFRYWRLWIRPAAMGTYAVLLLIVLPLCIVQLNKRETEPQNQAWFIGGMFVLMALPITVWEITQHLVHYTKPYLQKHIIRILWMVPIYALNAWLALLFPAFAIYMDTLRECYEAYVIYNFMIYLLNFLNAEMDLESVLILKPQVKHIFPFCCCPPWRNGSDLIENCKHGILQYTVVRPITTIIALICELADVYKENQFTASNAYTYIVCINNVSQFAAMYCLVLFYKANQEELKPMKPVAKFLCIKSVIFFSFFQGFVISILVWTNVIDKEFEFASQTISAATSLQDFLICIEMFLAAVAHLYAFSHHPYIDPEAELAPCCESFCAMLDISDVHEDVRNHIRVVGSSVKQRVIRRSGYREPESTERTGLLSNTSSISQADSADDLVVAAHSSTGQYQSLGNFCGDTIVINQNPELPEIEQSQQEITYDDSSSYKTCSSEFVSGQTFKESKSVCSEFDDTFSTTGDELMASANDITLIADTDSVLNESQLDKTVNDIPEKENGSLY